MFCLDYKIFSFAHLYHVLFRYQLPTTEIQPKADLSFWSVLFHNKFNDKFWKYRDFVLEKHLEEKLSNTETKKYKITIRPRLKIATILALADVKE